MIDVDVINNLLGKRFVSEANHIFKQLTQEVQDRISITNSITQTNFTKMNVLNEFLSEYVLLKVVSNVYRVLKEMGQRLTPPFELKGVLILHVLVVYYFSYVSTVTAKQNKDFFPDGNR